MKATLAVGMLEDMVDSPKRMKESPPDSPGVEVPNVKELSRNPAHIRHKKTLAKVYSDKECMNFLKCVPECHVKSVASYNDMTGLGLSRPWFKPEPRLEEDEDNVLSSRPMKISEISFADLGEEEVPNRVGNDMAVGRC